MGRVGRGDLLLDGARDRGQPGRVEPEVRVVARARRPAGRGVDDVVVAALVDRVVDRGLEAPLVDHDVGVRELRGLPDGQLEVVRLLPGLGQVR